ncbi:MAG TPA: hypothetical protein DGZ24_04560 [Rhodospirillaceae bacterium]|nr:hypothetical protein [Candidatus Neomarinimicrobiota bacterium]HCX14569.1 hypothetical protein [Rhodospirillaceae bacterium]
MMRFNTTRRGALKGMLAGSAVTVALPFLDCFLNENGNALAATGAPLPNRFGTWFWGCGMSPGQWEPKTEGKGFELSNNLKVLEPYREYVSVFSGLKAFLDGNPLRPHVSGIQSIMIGATGKEPDPSIDVIIADAIGSSTRFRSIEVATTGYASHTQSRRSSSVINNSEISPLALYKRLFGPEFQDPNAADFSPDPRVMMRKSVLSAIKEQRDRLNGIVGATDRARLDEYYTSLRQIEQELELQLTKPAPLDACTVLAEPAEVLGGTDIEVATANHKLFARLMAHAIACDQTRVINVSFSDGPSSLRKSGKPTTHHIYTHEEQIDEELGYQPGAVFFERKNMEAYSALPAALSSIKEGDGTLLDRTLMLVASEHGLAKHHSLENIPVFLVGGAGGRIKTGYHFARQGDPTTRVGLTIQQAFGLPVSGWGHGSLHTTRPFTELLA